MSRRVHLDANVILRFLRNDEPEQAPIAAGLFRRAQAKEVELIASPVILLEVFYVLARTYGQPRVAVAKLLHTLVSSGLVACEDGGILLEALLRITANKILLWGRLPGGNSRPGEGGASQLRQGRRSI